jgi:hypothetical protein
MAITRLGGANAITGTIPQGNIANASLGAVTALPAGVGGKVLQVVTATDGTERNSTSTSFVTVSNTLSVNITPSSSSNKVFVNVSTSTYNGTAGKSVYLTIYRDSTNLGNSNGLIRNLVSGGAAGAGSSCAILDSPSTTSQVTYQVYVRSDNAGTLYLNANGKGTITAFEIEG